MVVSFVLILIIVALAMLLLSVRVILKKNGRFGAKHIGQSSEMRKRGIKCVQSMDADERTKNRMQQYKKNR